MSFAYVNRPRLLLRACTERSNRLVARVGRGSQWESRCPLVPPPQTRCLGRSNTGRSLAVLPPRSHAARPAHQLLSARQSCWIYPLNKGGSTSKPLDPGKVGTVYTSTTTTTTPHPHSISVCGDNPEMVLFLKKIIRRNLTQT